MSHPTCSIENCKKRNKIGETLCVMHLRRLERFGTTELPVPSDLPELRKCTKCGLLLSRDKFDLGRRGRNRKISLNSRCKDCLGKERRSPRQRAKSNAAARRWAIANKDYVRERQRDYRRKIRAEALAAYGNACRCCGETEPKFLAIDHVNNDGAHYSRAVSTGYSRGSGLYLWLRQRGYPQDGRFQVLCHNCNMAKGFYGSCPHAA